MNVIRYETKLHKDADRLHQHAQNTGEPAAYIAAAQLYEKAGDYLLAAVCREAAERLSE